MDDKTGYQPAGRGLLHYRKWGDGAKLLLAFHGYGDAADLFQPIAAYLSKEYTIYSFDLPHHGHSQWDEKMKLTSAQLAEMTLQLLHDHGTGRCTLMGYSLGGRLCLAIMEQVPGAIDRMVLIAPDGLKKDPYYYFFTRSWVGQKIFRNLLERPEPYFKLMHLLKTLRLVHLKRYKFAMHFLQTTESRALLLQVWPGMSEIVPEPETLKNTIARYRIPITIFMGATDKIIPPASGRQFIAGLDTVKLQLLERGHRIIDHETAGQIAADLLLVI